MGSRPHVGRSQIERFYDTFIGPREITFHRDLDIVSGTSVIRDLTLEVGMGSGVRLMNPVFLRYDLHQAGGDWRITRLRAYWELSTLLGQFIRHGVRSLPASLALSTGLLRNQGLRGTTGFLSGLRGAGRRGKHLVEDALSAGQLAEHVPECKWDKVIAAGNTVAVAITTPSGRGVLFVELDDRGREITDVSVFHNEA
ncbi:MAG: transporter [Mycobacterium sp.]|uniref:transporter n=1 Tax=Mycobacterium sp. TaxID=1785 RepID=UPI003C72F20D